jgi:periplasmic protein TonB
MFTGLQPARSPFRRNRAVGLSVAAHLALLALIAFHNSGAIDLSSTSLAFGESAHTYKLVYFPPSSNNETSPQKDSLTFSSRLTKPKPRPQLTKRDPDRQPVVNNADAADRNSQAGSPLGTMIDGPITGHEVHVAYPIIYPDPPVERSTLPRDLIGDVVIEVTIDSQGNVVETKIVQAIGHGIDEKIEATLRRWQYQPATLDGTPVASRHDVHFHFPS